jgi:defect in organelle trafficking protein DotB
MNNEAMNQQIIYPHEPNRFTPAHLEPLLEFCTRAKASDITLQSGENVVIEVYGRLYKITKRKLTNTEVGDLLNAMYGPNGTTQILSGQDVDTHYEIRPTRGDRFRFRVNGTGCQVEGHPAIQITLRTIPNEPPRLSELNLPQEILEAAAPNDGVVYVTGATGSGKSTLLAAIIRNIVENPESHRKILTYESPIEFVFDSIVKPTSLVSQSEIPRNLPSFAAGVRNALRRKPRLILVGEARDSETISAVLEAALTGHPVYTTLHANGVAETIRRLVGTFPKEERYGRSIDIIETLRLIIWQQLVPTVDGKRIALREYLIFEEDIRDALLSVNPDEATAITRKLVKEKGQPMIVDAQKAFKDGIISERTFMILSVGHKRADRDAGVI